MRPRPTCSAAPKLFQAALAVLLAVLASPGRLPADTTSLSGAQEITSLPYNITAPGVYYLSQSFSLNTNSANAITVQADGVTIDLNGHTISDLAAGNGVQVNAIYAPSCNRLTVRNGVIRGFLDGVYVPAGYGHLVENVRFTDCTYAAVFLVADGSTVRRCQAWRPGGSTLSWAAASGFGLLIYGSNHVVQDNEVGGAASAGASTVGIYLINGNGGLVLGNRIDTAQNGVVFGNATGVYRDNLCAASVTTPYTGGTDVGNN